MQQYAKLPIAQGTQMWMSDMNRCQTSVKDVQQTCLVPPNGERLEVLQPRHCVEEICPRGWRIHGRPSLHIYPISAAGDPGPHTEAITLGQVGQGS